MQQAGMGASGARARVRCESGRARHEAAVAESRRGSRPLFKQEARTLASAGLVANLSCLVPVSSYSCTTRSVEHTARRLLFGDQHMAVIRTIVSCGFWIAFQCRNCTDGERGACVRASEGERGQAWHDALAAPGLCFEAKQKQNLVHTLTVGRSQSHVTCHMSHVTYCNSTCILYILIHVLQVLVHCHASRHK